MDNLLKGIAGIVPFMAPYPTWVKALFAGWVAVSATLLIALVVGRPSSVTAEPSSSGSVSTTEDPAWLVIRGLEFLAAVPGVQVRVTAIVNGTEYLYPSVAGVEWLGVGPAMAAQTFRLPPTRDRYVVRFSAEVRVVDADGEVSATGQLTSVTEQHVELDEVPVSREYVLHTFDPVHMSRSSEAEALLRYSITNDPS